MKSPVPYIVIIVILLIAVGGEFAYFHFMRQINPVQQNSAYAMKGPRPTGKMHMAMVAVTPPVMSSQQTQQVTDGSDKSATQKTFNITGGNFYFVPNKITVNKGDTVTLVMTNAGGFHNINIDEFNVKSQTVTTGNATVVTFVANKTGSFVYYCSVPTHRQRGMWGTLTVQ